MVYSSIVWEWLKKAPRKRRVSPEGGKKKEVLQ